MKRLITWWICILVISATNAQNLGATLQLAAANLDRGELNEAEFLYSRVSFFDKSGIYKAKTLEGLAHLAYMKEDYSRASNYFLSLNRLSQNATDYYYHILALIKAEQWMSAKAGLFTMEDSTHEMTISKKILMGLVDFNIGEVEMAKLHFDDAEKLLKVALDTEGIFRKMKRVHKKNKIKAIILSGVLPGLGQAYSGHIKEGVNSLFVVGAIGVVYLYTLTNIGAIDGLISIMPWFHRYYVGGMNTAAEMVDRYKREELMILHNELVRSYGQYIQ